jgi:tetratricopeptide (TPR) repeat protein
MRRAQAEEAFQGGDFDRALVEADELLAASPQDPGALWVLARAALAIGDACTAEVALDQILDLEEAVRPAPVGQIQTEMAFARFLQADFAAARTAAASALTLDRDLAAAWVCLGLAEERLGRISEMTDAFNRAEELHPGSVPKRLPSPSPETWERMLQTAKQHLSEDESQLISGLMVTWDQWPARDLLTSVAPPISPFIEVLIAGDDTTRTDPVDQLDAALQEAIPSPTSISIYTANLLRGQPSTADLVDRLVRSIRSELAAWLGIPPEDLAPEQE